MPENNERTSKRVAAIAGRVLKQLERVHSDKEPCRCSVHECARFLGVTVDDLKALAASALNQAPDKPKAKR